MENPSGVSDSPWFVILGGVQSLSKPHAPLRCFSSSSEIAVMNKMCTVPRLSPPSSSKCAPTTKSIIPFPSKSPMLSTPIPNLSPSSSVGPFVVESLISTVDFTEPFVFMNIRCKVPRLLPVSS